MSLRKYRTLRLRRRSAAPATPLQEAIQPTFRRFMEDNSISGKENRVKLKLADESQ
ncbi:MAG: hypothetical protein ACK5CA_14665 [Cyanobacteriota bacterium]